MPTLLRTCSFVGTQTLDRWAAGYRIGVMHPNPYEREMEMAEALRRRRHGNRRSSPATAWSLIVIGALIVIMFLPALADELLAYRRQAGVAGLPTVTGKVLESRVHAEARRGPTPSLGHRTTPVIRYRYEVDGRSYESSRFAFQEFVMLEDECEAIVARHPPGAAVKVHYHPGDPERAAISTRPAVLNHFIVTLCGAMLLLGTGAMAGGVRARPWRVDDTNSDERKF
jgi:hypothetical protein